MRCPHDCGTGQVIFRWPSKSNRYALAMHTGSLVVRFMIPTVAVLLITSCGGAGDTSTTTTPSTETVASSTTVPSSTTVAVDYGLRYSEIASLVNDPRCAVIEILDSLGQSQEYEEVRSALVPAAGLLESKSVEALELTSAQQWPETVRDDIPKLLEILANQAQAAALMASASSFVELEEAVTYWTTALERTGAVATVIRAKLGIETNVGQAC